MEVGENRVRVFYGAEKREGERLEIYTGGISPYRRTVYQTYNIMYICNIKSYPINLIFLLISSCYTYLLSDNHLNEHN
jgi:hypothetical protein